MFLLRGALCLFRSGVLWGVPSFLVCCLFRGAGPSAGGLRCAVVLRRWVLAHFGVVLVTWEVYVFLFFNIYQPSERLGNSLVKGWRLERP